MGTLKWTESLSKKAERVRWKSEENVTDNEVLVVPTSFAQQRLWLLDQFEPGSNVYNIPMVTRLTGPLCVSILERSFNEIVRRHESLRTSFSVVEGQPVQVISTLTQSQAEHKLLTLSRVDLGCVPDNQREKEVDRLVSEEARGPFDLERGQLLRVTLLRLGEHDHVLLLTMHHIISDAWSMGILYRELSVLYEAFSAGKQSPLPELSIQYADFAVWQREWLQGKILQDQLSYWRGQLDGAPSILELPTDRPRPAIQTFRGAIKSFVLPEKLTTALKQLSQQEGVSLFMTLLAAFKTLLHRYTGQTDIVVGSSLAGRIRVEIENLIGFFVNTLVFRTKIYSDLSFKDMLSRVREVCLDAFDHQDLPFERLVEELQPKRHLSHTTLFQAMFTLHNASRKPLEIPGMTVHTVKSENDTAKFDLSLSMTEVGKELKGRLEYNSDLFDGATINRMAGHFERLLEGIEADPAQRLSDLTLLTEEERHQLVFEWNQTQADYPKDVCVHHLVEAQVERTPDSIALTCDDKQLTYRELNNRANKIAHYLKKRGVGPEVLVGICVERSLELVVGELGILKAGGAFVPLDSHDPKDRLRFMMDDAHVTVLLTNEQVLEMVPDKRHEVVCLDRDWNLIDQETEDFTPSDVKPQNLAYVIYTSGSTGRPKGVEIQHGGVVNVIDWTQRAYGLAPTDRTTQIASPAFDATVSELWPKLAAGANIHIPDDETRAHLSRLREWLVTEAITISYLPTPLAEAFLDEECTEGLALRTLITGGQEIHRRPRGVLPFRFMNAYGPTEHTDLSTWGPIASSAETDMPLHIGRPISNKQIFLLDRNLHLVPIGVFGELHIGGVGIARCYLNRPGETAEKFIPHSFSSEPGSRLYKTGDLARYMPDGNIEFLGRIDHQVKIRGFRVELGEIELALTEHPGVKHAAVIARKDSRNDNQLVAYVVIVRGSLVAIDDLRDFLKGKLPDYMVPSTFVLLDTMPLTPNGKVDRSDLPSPEMVRPNHRGVFAGPRDTLELELVQIWEEALSVCPIGINDNFFELGGHSLLAARLVSKVQKRFGRGVTLTTIFKEPTIEGLARILRDHARSSLWSPVVGLQPNGSKKPLFFVHPVGGSVLCYLDLARHLGSDQPFYGLQHPGLDGERKSYTSIEEIATRYIGELRSVQSEGPYILGGWSMGGVVAFEMTQQLKAQGHEVDLLALLDTWNAAPDEKQERVGRAELLNIFSQNLGLSLDNLPFTRDDFLRLEPDVQLTFVLEQVQAANLVTSDFGLAQIRRQLEVLVSNLQANMSYLPRTYTGRVVLLSATDERSVVSVDPTNGWNEFVAEGLEAYEVPGSHYTMLREPHVGVLAERLKTCLDEAQRR